MLQFEMKYQFTIPHDAGSNEQWWRCVGWLNKCSTEKKLVGWVDDISNPDFVLDPELKKKWRNVLDFKLLNYDANLQFGTKAFFVTLESPMKIDTIQSKLIEIFDQMPAPALILGEYYLSDPKSSALRRLLELAAIAPSQNERMWILKETSRLIESNIPKKPETYTTASATANLSLLKRSTWPIFTPSHPEAAETDEALKEKSKESKT